MVLDNLIDNRGSPVLTHHSLNRFSASRGRSSRSSLSSAIDRGSRTSSTSSLGGEGSRTPSSIQSSPSSPDLKRVLGTLRPDERTRLLGPTRLPSRPALIPDSKDNGSGPSISRTVQQWNGAKPNTVQFSRRKAPIAPAVSYLMEVMCTDLVACGECFVPDAGEGHTLVSFERSVPIRIDEALDLETTAYMEAHDSATYRLGVGLPGFAWSSGKVVVKELLMLVRDQTLDAGGERLAKAARLFHSALTVPLYSSHGIRVAGIECQKLVGVVVIYFPAQVNHISALLTYANAVAASASSISELMVHRAKFVDSRINSVKRNFRIMKIALKFMLPMLKRYLKDTGRRIVDAVEVDDIESGLLVTPALAKAAFRIPLRRFSMKPELRSQHVVPRGVAQVLASREAPATTAEGGFKEWFVQYVGKARGGDFKLQDMIQPVDATLSWVGAFLGIGITQILLMTMNKYVTWRGQGNLFALSGSFGALSTLVYAMPAAIVSPPRVIFMAHGLSAIITMVIMNIFEPGEMVWFQKAVSVATIIWAMCLARIVHPPAGALCLVILGAFNRGASHEEMLMLFLSVLVGLIVHVAVAVMVGNLSPRRAYPSYW